MESREKLFKQYKTDCPQTIGENDKAFDNDNFIDWLCQQNKALLEEIERLKESNQQQEIDIKRLKSIQSQETTRADELQNEVERLKSELKDCAENYNHYVDKCFKLESELKAKELISVEDVDNIQELKSQIALLEIQLKSSKQDVEMLKFELKAADSVNEQLQRELEIFKN